MFTIGQFARINHISAKTLRHYDSIGLLAPVLVDEENQYRYYSREQVPLLRRILFFRELGMGLEVIRELVQSGAMHDPARVEAILREHALVIQEEIAKRNELLARIDEAVTAAHEDGGEVAGLEKKILIKELPAMEVVSAHGIIRTDEEKQELIEEAEAKLRGRPAATRINVYHNTDAIPEFFDLEIMFPVASGGEKTILAMQVASLLYEEEMAIGDCYRALYMWIYENGFVPSQKPFDVFTTKPDHPRGYEREIQVPFTKPLIGGDRDDA